MLPELLEEVFELNMALEEMRGGDESVRPQLVQARGEFHGHARCCRPAAGELVRKIRCRSPQKETLGEIRGVLNRRKYILNLVNEVFRGAESFIRNIVNFSNRLWRTGARGRNRSGHY